MAKTWEEFFIHVQPHVPGCPEITMTTHLRSAAADFCAMSEVWRYAFDTEYTVDGFAIYELGVPNDAVIENILSLRANQRLLARITDIDHAPQPDTVTGAPLNYSTYQDHSIRLYPVPDASYVLTGECVLKPSQTSTGVEDFIFETHGRSIACGALATLMVTPGKEWTNPELATYYRLKFSKSMDDAKGRDTQRANRRVRPIKFA